MSTKVAIVGCGGIHDVHAKALRELPGVELALVCDLRPEAAKASAEKNGGIPFCTDFDAVLADEAIEAVHLCTPHFLHAPMSIAAMQAGKAVLCEKPLATTLADAQKVVDEKSRLDGFMGVCFQNRYRPVVRRLRAYVQGGALGMPLGGRAFVTWNRDASYYTSSDWKGRWAKEGGSLNINQSIHTLDLLQWMFGEFADVRGTIRRHKFEGVIETEDTAELQLSCAGGLKLLYYATNAHCEDSNVFIEVVFENATARVEEQLTVKWRDGRVESFADVEEGDTGNIGDTVAEKAYWGNTHKTLIADFYDCLHNHRPFAIGPEEGIKTIRLLDRVYGDKSINLL